MKKALICFICIVVVIIAAYGAKNISSGKQVENDTTYENSIIVAFSILHKEINRDNNQLENPF